MPVVSDGGKFRISRQKSAPEAVQTSFVLSYSIIESLASSGTAVRKFPLPGTKMMLKLRLSKHGYVVKDEHGGKTTIESRVGKVIERLAQVSEKEGLSSSMGSTRTPPPMLRASKGKSSERTSGPPKKELPTVPVKEEDDFGIIRYKGEKPCVVRRIIAKNGAPVFYSAKFMELVEIEEGNTDFMSTVDTSKYETGSYSNLYDDLMHNMYSNPAEDGQENEDSSEARNDQLDSDVDLKTIDICWEYPCAGLISSIEVQEGCKVEPNDIVVKVRTTPKYQQLAHLYAADKLGFSNRQGKTNINNCFQSLTEKFVNSIASGAYHDVDAILKSCQDLEGAVRDFTHTARTYGRVIISEIHLAVEEKTIRPISLGGVLGGHKYVVRGVLFKIPDGEMFRNYPDPLHIANKIQGHELKGLKAYFGWFFNRGTIGVVSFPLTAIIDFKGHRITAMTQLPIDGSKSLIYGSENAGGECTVKNEIPSWSNFIREASLGLHLKSHYVVNGRSENGELEIASCVDLEGHKGRDQRHYLLDFSRALPCAYKSSETRRSYDQLWPYYHLFRAEFVAKYKCALCADGFSNFQSTINQQRRDEATANNSDIKEATDYLLNHSVKKVTQGLLLANDENLSIAHVFHREGVNMRYLGIVYEEIVGPGLFQMSQINLYRQLQVEGLMRVFKAHLRMSLRNASMQTSSKEDSESRILDETCRVLNGLFAKANGYDHWNQINGFVFESLQRDFNFTKSHAKKAIETFLSQDRMHTVGATGMKTKVSVKFAVLKRLDEVVGLGIDARVMNELQSDDKLQVKGRSFSRSKVFWDFDFNFQEKVKHLDILERVRGLSEYLRGKQHRTDAFECFIRAFGILAKVLEASPSDAWLNLLMADLCRSIWEVSDGNPKDSIDVQLASSNSQVAALFKQRALSYYQQSLDSDGNSHNAQRNFGMFLSKIGRLEEAEDCLVKSLELAGDLGLAIDGTTLLELVHVLEALDKKELAAQLKRQSRSWINESSRVREVVPERESDVDAIRLSSSASGIYDERSSSAAAKKDKGIALRKLKNKIASAGTSILTRPRGSGSIRSSESSSIWLRKNSRASGGEHTQVDLSESGIISTISPKTSPSVSPSTSPRHSPPPSPRTSAPRVVRRGAGKFEPLQEKKAVTRKSGFGSISKDDKDNMEEWMEEDASASPSSVDKTKSSLWQAHSSLSQSSPTIRMGQRSSNSTIEITDDNTASLETAFSDIEEEISVAIERNKQLLEMASVSTLSSDSFM